MNKYLFVAATCAAALGLADARPASAALINTTERGWYNSTGFHDPLNSNYITGFEAFGAEYRNFLVFDLSSVSGTVVAAQLQLFNPISPPANGPGYVSPNPTETYNLYDVSTPIATLTAGGSGLTSVFNDLGTGTVLGTATVSAADNGQYVNINLNAAGLAAVNAALGGQLAIGGALNFGVPQNSDRFVFSWTNFNEPADGNTRADLITRQIDPTVVPAPAGLLLGLLGVVPAGALVRRRRAATAA